MPLLRCSSGSLAIYDLTILQMADAYPYSRDFEFDDNDYSPFHEAISYPEHDASYENTSEIVSQVSSQAFVDRNNASPFTQSREEHATTPTEQQNRHQFTEEQAYSNSTMINESQGQHHLQHGNMSPTLGASQGFSDLPYGMQSNFDFQSSNSNIGTYLQPQRQQNFQQNPYGALHSGQSPPRPSSSMSSVQTPPRYERNNSTFEARSTRGFSYGPSTSTRRARKHDKGHANTYVEPQPTQGSHNSRPTDTFKPTPHSNRSTDYSGSHVSTMTPGFLGFTVDSPHTSSRQPYPDVCDPALRPTQDAGGHDTRSAPFICSVPQTNSNQHPRPDSDMQ